MTWLDEPESAHSRRAIHETIQLPCPRCGAPTGQMCVNTETGVDVLSTCYERRLQNKSDDVQIGDGRVITYALAIWPTDIISRATLRSFLPKGTSRLPGGQKRLTNFRKGDTIGTSKRNPTSEHFKDQLHRLEDAGLIYRGTEFVRIIGRRELLDRALYCVSNPTHEKFLPLHDAANTVRRQIQQEQRPKVREVRENELRIIKSLMQPDHYSGRDGTRRTVRHESGDIAIPLGETARRWNPTKNRTAK